MSMPIIPWSTCSIPTEIQTELERRKKNIGMRYVVNDGWNSNGGNWENYKGPTRSWIRVCSNGVGRPELKKPGFIMGGARNFYQTYGFKWNNQTDVNGQILGYTPTGIPHILEYDKNTSQYPIHVPPPEITSIETVIQKELFRRCLIHWVCYSSKQLEYLTPYFLVPRITMIIEFGWNNFNENSLIDLSDTKKLKEYYFKNPYPLYNENVLHSNGNYDVVYGLVTNWNWAINGNKIDCTTEVTSLQRLYAGVPISSIVVEKKDVSNPKSELNYFANIRQICNSDFIKNLKIISTSETLDSVSLNASGKQLYQIIKGGTTENKPEMNEEYWRGIFYGRDNQNIEKSSDLDYKWSKPKEGDFDTDPNNDNNVWVNMGFIVELLNRCFPVTSPEKDSGFFEVNIDESVIGAHPNLISCDGTVLLIPNAKSPKYMWGKEGIAENGSNGDYANQFIGGSTKVIKQVKDKNDPMWNADYQLCQLFKQGSTPVRDDLDWIINSNRYLHNPTRDFYCFPFAVEESIPVKNRSTEAKYDANFYGYFKDLYFNVKKFVELVNNDEIKTYTDLYQAMFEEINKAGGNFWHLSLVPNENTSKLIVTDDKMIPAGNNKQKPWYFDYNTSDQLITNLSFNPKMSDAQACKVVFCENNNSDSKTVVKSENDLLNYQFSDTILDDMKNESPTLIAANNSSDDPFLSQIKNLQHFQTTGNEYQFTIMVGDKPYFRRLVLPDSSMLDCLLDDHDVDKNQRYTGIQPITVELTLQGIGGLRTFMTFMIRNLPNPYSHKDVAFQIVDVQHRLEDGKWTTTIKAGIRPLRGYIKEKLGITE